MTEQTTSTSSAWRGLSPGFIAALEALTDAPEGQWWRDVLAHPDLVLAVRHDSLNVYHRGASIFLAELVGERIVARTHAKYLVRQNQTYASLATASDGGLGFDLAPGAAFWRNYEGKATLADMLKAAASLAGPEKIGLHALLMSSPHVVDVEIVLEGKASTLVTPATSAATAHSSPSAAASTIPATEGAASQTSDENPEISEAIEAADAARPVLDPEPDPKGAALDDDAASAAKPSPSVPPSSSDSAVEGGASRLDRLDVATLEERGGTIHLVFHEAKHFANKELRAAPSRRPHVLDQIERYEATLAQHGERLRIEYAAVCRSLVALEALRRGGTGQAGAAGGLDPLIRRVAEGETFDVDPLPRLVIFGFDDDQKKGPVWTKHLARLENALGSSRIYAVGNTRTKTSAAFR